MGSATTSWSNVLQPSISFLDTVSAAATVTVSGCSGGTSVYATVTLKIVARYYDANGTHISGADKSKVLGVRSGSGTGSAYAVYQEANYNAGLWTAGNRPSGAEPIGGALVSSNDDGVHGLSPVGKMPPSMAACDGYRLRSS